MGCETRKTPNTSFWEKFEWAIEPNREWQECWRSEAARSLDAYLTSRMSECFDKLGEARVSATLDAYCECLQVSTSEDDRPKTAFMCHASTHKYTRIAFGLMSLSAIFQRTLNLILCELKWQTCLVYLNHVYIFPEIVEKDVEQAEENSNLTENSRSHLEAEKVQILYYYGKVFGKIIKPGRLEVERANRSHFAKPSTLLSDQSWKFSWDSVTCRGTFIGNFTKKAHPLKQLRKTSSLDELELDEEKMESSRQLIDAACSSTVLALPVSGLPYAIDCDTSAYEIGCALF